MAGPESLEISPAELASEREGGDPQIVDVRTDEEWAEGRLAGSRHIELNDVSGAAETLEKERPLVFVCSAGNRSLMAAEAFSGAGFDARSLAGGLEAWAAEGRDLERPDDAG